MAGRINELYVERRTAPPLHRAKRGKGCRGRVGRGDTCSVRFCRARVHRRLRFAKRFPQYAPAMRRRQFRILLCAAATAALAFNASCFRIARIPCSLVFALEVGDGIARGNASGSGGRPCPPDLVLYRLGCNAMSPSSGSGLLYVRRVPWRIFVRAGFADFHFQNFSRCTPAFAEGGMENCSIDLVASSYACRIAGPSHGIAGRRAHGRRSRRRGHHGHLRFPRPPVSGTSRIG